VFVKRGNLSSILCLTATRGKKGEQVFFYFEESSFFSYSEKEGEYFLSRKRGGRVSLFFQWQREEGGEVHLLSIFPNSFLRKGKDERNYSLVST